MRKSLLISTAAIALIAGASFVNAQGTGGGSGSGGGSGGATSASPGASGSGGAGGSGGMSGGSGASGAERSTTQPREPSPSGGSAQRPSSSGSDQNQAQTPRGSDQNRAQGQSDQGRGQAQSPRQGEGAGQNQRTGQDGQRGRDQQTTGAAPSGTSVSTEQRTQIRQRLGSVREARVDRVDFSISVGTVVPRTVRVYDLPPTIIEIVPAYRGYKYIVVRDEILIIEPSTLKIVMVIDA